MRRRLGPDRAHLRDGDLEVGEHLEQEGLEGLVGPVDLVDEQHRRAGQVGLERLEEGPAHQEALGEEVLLDALPIDHVGRLGDPDLEHLARVVPLVGGLREVEPLVALQPDEAPAQRRGEHLGHLGLADAGLALEEERAAEAQREVEGGGEAPVGDVPARGEEPLDLVDRAGRAGVITRASPSEVTRTRPRPAGPSPRRGGPGSRRSRTGRRSSPPADTDTAVSASAANRAVSAFSRGGRAEDAGPGAGDRHADAGRSLRHHHPHQREPGGGMRELGVGRLLRDREADGGDHLVRGERRLVHAPGSTRRPGCAVGRSRPSRRAPAAAAG